jgi:hypothetical protein
MDSRSSSKEQQARTFRNAQRYLKALERDLPEPARRPWEIVSRFVAEMKAKTPRS